MAWAASRRTRQWLAVVGLAAVMAGHGAITEWQRNHAFMVNASDSLPHWAFFVEKEKSPKRGDYVFFEPPASPLLRAHFGIDSGPFGKKILGVPGDVVRHTHRLVTINYNVVGSTKPLTRSGMPLARGPEGVIPEGCYYAGTDHPDGFDSRYSAIGFVCQNKILGTGTPIL